MESGLPPTPPPRKESLSSQSKTETPIDKTRPQPKRENKTKPTPLSERNTQSAPPPVKDKTKATAWKKCRELAETTREPTTRILEVIKDITNLEFLGRLKTELNEISPYSEQLPDGSTQSGAAQAVQQHIDTLLTTEVENTPARAIIRQKAIKRPKQTPPASPTAPTPSKRHGFIGEKPTALTFETKNRIENISTKIMNLHAKLTESVYQKMQEDLKPWLAILNTHMQLLDAHPTTEIEAAVLQKAEEAEHQLKEMEIYGINADAFRQVQDILKSKTPNIAELYQQLDNCSLEQLATLKDSKIHKKALPIINSKILSLKVMEHSKKESDKFFREGGSPNTLRILEQAIQNQKTTLFKINNQDGLRILDDHHGLAKYVKKQLKERYKMDSATTSTLLTTFQNQQTLTDKILFVHLLDAIYSYCGHAATNPNNNPQLGLHNAALSMGPSLYNPDTQFLIDTRIAGSMVAPVTPEIKEARIKVSLPMQEFLKNWPEAKKQMVIA